MSDVEIEARYAEIVESLSKVEDVETKQYVIELIEGGFAPLDLDTLGRTPAMLEIDCEDRSISQAEADRILMESGRLEISMTDGEKLAAVNEITGENYTEIDHSEQASA